MGSDFVGKACTPLSVDVTGICRFHTRDYRKVMQKISQHVQHEGCRFLSETSMLYTLYLLLALLTTFHRLILTRLHQLMI